MKLISKRQVSKGKNKKRTYRRKNKKSTRRKNKYDGIKNINDDEKIYNYFKSNLLKLEKINDNIELIDFLINDSDFDNEDKIRIFNGLIQIVTKDEYFNKFIDLLNKIQYTLTNFLSIPPISKSDSTISRLSFNEIKIKILKDLNKALVENNFQLLNKLLDLIIKIPDITINQKKEIYNNFLNTIVNKAVTGNITNDENKFNNLCYSIENILKLNIIDPDEIDKKQMLALFTKLFSSLKLARLDFLNTKNEKWFHRIAQTQKLLDMLGFYEFNPPQSLINDLVTKDKEGKIIEKHTSIRKTKM